MTELSVSERAPRRWANAFSLTSSACELQPCLRDVAAVDGKPIAVIVENNRLRVDMPVQVTLGWAEPDTSGGARL